MKAHFPAAWALLVLMVVPACKSRSAQDTTGSSAAVAEADLRPAARPPVDSGTLLLTMAQFDWEQGQDGKRRPKPGAAKLRFLRSDGETFADTVLEDPDSRVFHKAMCVQGKRGTELLTIGGSDAYLKRWHHDGSDWLGETLWHTAFGGKWDRLRDFELADVTGNGKHDIVIATHDQGVVVVVSEDAKGTWQVTELMRQADTFVHEVEVGDVLGEGRPQIYVTPSQPNRADHSQAGEIAGFSFQEDGTFKKFPVVAFQKSHAKEILVTDLDGDGKSELYVAIEAQRGKDGKEVEPVRVERLIPDGARWRRQLLATIEGGLQARVLLAADLKGSGRKSLVVTTMKGGIWLLHPPLALSDKQPWEKELVDATSSGFEHAAMAADLGGDGSMKLYVTADDQDEVRQYHWDGTRFQMKVIAQLEASDLTWNIVQCDPIAL